MKITIAQALPGQFQGVKGKDITVKEEPIIVPWPTRYNNDWACMHGPIAIFESDFGCSWALILG